MVGFRNVGDLSALNQYVARLDTEKLIEALSAASQDTSRKIVRITKEEKNEGTTDMVSARRKVGKSYRNMDLRDSLSNSTWRCRL